MSSALPAVPGFRLVQDPLTRQWIGTSPSGYTIRGWTQRELDDDRWALWLRILDGFRVALAEVYPRYISAQPPRRHPAVRATGAMFWQSREAGQPARFR